MHRASKTAEEIKSQKLTKEMVRSFNKNRSFKSSPGAAKRLLGGDGGGGSGTGDGAGRSQTSLKYSLPVGFATARDYEYSDREL